MNTIHSVEKERFNDFMNANGYKMSKEDKALLDFNFLFIDEEFEDNKFYIDERGVSSSDLNELKNPEYYYWRSRKNGEVSSFKDSFNNEVKIGDDIFYAQHVDDKDIIRRGKVVYACSHLIKRHDGGDENGLKYFKFKIPTEVGSLRILVADEDNNLKEVYFPNPTKAENIVKA